jgi:hypothetical protein
MKELKEWLTEQVRINRDKATDLHVRRQELILYQNYASCYQKVLDKLISLETPNA